MYSLISFTTVFAFSSSILAQQCYFPNGNEVGSDTACNPNAIVSACCFDGQACLSNGLCVSDPKNVNLARTHRGTCTDKTWKSGNCPRHCLDIDDNGTNVYSCNQTNTESYCCFDNCQCNSRFETFSFDQTPADVYTVTIIGDADFTPQTQPPTSSSAPTSSAQSAATTASDRVFGTAVATGTPSADSSKSPSSTAIGVGVGVGVAGAALIATAAFFLWRRKRGSNNNNTYGDGTPLKPVEVANSEYYPPVPAAKYAYYTEERGVESPVRSELPVSTYEPAELPASAPLHPKK